MTLRLCATYPRPVAKTLVPVITDRHSHCAAHEQRQPANAVLVLADMARAAAGAAAAGTEMAREEAQREVEFLAAGESLRIDGYLLGWSLLSHIRCRTAMSCKRSLTVVHCSSS